MNDFMVEELAKENTGTTFVHYYAGIVNTGIGRELPKWTRWPAKAFYLIAAPFMVGVEETGTRQLFIATSGLYPPKQGKGDLVAGVRIPNGLKAMLGSDGTVGSGAYVVNWNNEITGKQSLLNDYRERGSGNIVWEHTMGVFERDQKLNKDRPSQTTSSTI